MATRSRTPLFLQYRQSLSRAVRLSTSSSARYTPSGGPTFADSEKTGLIAHGGGHASDTEDDGGGGGGGAHVSIPVTASTLPPAWTDTVQDIESALGAVRDGLTQLEPMYKKHLLPGFVEDYHVEQQQQIERLSSHITQQIQLCQRKIKQIPHLAAGAAGQQEHTLARNVQTSLATKLQALSTDFRKAQSLYMQRLNHAARGGGSGAASGGKTFAFDGGSDGGPRAEGGLLDDDNEEEEFIDTGFTDVQLAQASQNETAINARTRDIDAIAQRIHDLAALFGDLQTLVIDQGSLLDRIDYNVEQTAVNVVKANEELDKGEKYQKRSRKWLVILLLILAIVAVVIILIVKNRSRG
ncbi:t-SNARE affecting a late Golgi compartment protein 2 [Sorochytrium milnesiophthora]